MPLSIVPLVLRWSTTLTTGLARSSREFFQMIDACSREILPLRNSTSAEESRPSTVSPRVITNSS
jgi:hypothetical protein